jgi:molybdopterin molybdotransferase
MISVEEALQFVETNIPKGPSQTITIADALGHTLSKDIISAIDMPPFPQSAMDGYALNYVDSISEYLLIGEVAAGSDQQFELTKGDAVRTQLLGKKMF